MSKRKLGFLAMAVVLGIPVPTFAFPVNNTVIQNATVRGLSASMPVCTDAASQLITTACPGGNSSPPTAQKFLSGSGTYTTPSGVQWIKVLAVGGGGGGEGGGTSPGNGGTGGSTTFGTSLITSAGGVGGTTGVFYGGTGGAATLAAGPLGYAANGGDGIAAISTLGGGNGGSSCLGGAGSGSGNNIGEVGHPGATNTGGGGGASQGSPGGGSGACIEAVISTPAATYAYAVGAAGTAGAAGTGGFAGGAGGSGVIVVTEYYTGGPIGTGTVTNVTGTGNISVATGTTTPVVSETNAPTFTGTATVGNVINNGLTASQCAGTNGSKQMISSGEACPKSFQNGTRVGGLHVESGSGSAAAGAAFTLTFGTAYTAAPDCTGGVVGSSTSQAVSMNPAPTTTAANFVNNGGTTHTVAGICVGW